MLIQEYTFQKTQQRQYKKSYLYNTVPIIYWQYQGTIRNTELWEQKVSNRLCWSDKWRLG